jgi:Phasin protein
MHSAQEHRIGPSPTKVWSVDSWFINPFAAIASAGQVQEGPSRATVSPIEAMMRTAAQSANPWVQACSRSNLELFGLMSRRSQAAMALPAQAAQCKSPQDLMSLQAQFWQTAVQQHTEAARRVASLWSSVLRR